MPPGDRLSLGYVAAVLGLRGQVKVRTYSGDAGSLSPGVTVHARTRSGNMRTLTVADVQSRRGFNAVRFAGLDRVEDAEKLVGAELLVDKESLPPTEPDEYYWDDLIGCTVETEGGRVLGTVSGLIETGAAHVLCVGEGKQELLLPMIASVVRSVDIAAKRIVVDAAGYIHEN